MSDEPWIEHDGTCHPVAKGAIAQVMWFDGGTSEFRPISAGYGWLWRSLDRSGWTGNYAPIIRYRIRKPRGLTILEGLLESLPERVDA